jgi:2-oxoisovalerate ferredoxin oxidoreductase beta subunit
MLNSLDAPVFIERVALGNNKQIMQAAKVIKRAVENQVKGLGFSFVEVLSPCPTIWKMQPVEAQRFIQEEMASIFGLGNLRDRSAETPARPDPQPPPSLDDLPGLLDVANGVVEPERPSLELDLRVKVAGFGGQGVLMLGEVLAEAGLEAGYEVSWLPSYGPEMRSGTSNCHVRLSRNPIDSPLVSLPNVLLAMNEPSLRKFLPTVDEGGIVFYNGAEVPPGCSRPDVRIVAIPFTRVADELGASKVANIVLLGALLEATGILEQDRVVAALKRLVKNPRFFELDMSALARGREELRAAQSDDYLWGV